MFEHHIFGSQEFLTHLRGNLLGWQESRARRRAMYAQQAAPASSAATMQTVTTPRPAPAGHTPGPTDGLVLVCYRHEQGQFVPVYAHVADIPVVEPPASAPPAGDSARGPEAAPPAASEPASPPPAASPANPAATVVPPPNFSAESVEASAPHRPSARQAPMIDLPPPTRPPLMRASEEKAEAIEQLLAAHRADMQAAEARHTTAVQGILAGHRSDMEAAEARHKTAVQEILAGHRSDMEAAEARQSAAVQSALEEHRQSISELIASRREPVAEQVRPDADALAFAQLRELLAEQADVMKDEHDRTTSAIRDIAEMIANLGAIVSGVAVAVAEQKTPTFPPLPRRAQAQGEGAQRPPKAAPPAVATPAPALAARERIPAHCATPMSAVVQPARSQPATTLSVTAPNTGPATATVVPSQPAAAVSRDPTQKEPAPAAAVPSQPEAAVQSSAQATPVPAQPAPAVQHPAPATTVPSQPAAAPQAPAPATPSPPTQGAAPARPLTVVRNSEPIHRTPARTGATSLTASLMHLFASGPQVTASASPTPRQRREEEEARERGHIHDLVDDVPDDELEDVQDEGEASHV